MACSFRAVRALKVGNIQIIRPDHVWLKKLICLFRVIGGLLDTEYNIKIVCCEIVRCNQVSRAIPTLA